MNGTIRRLSQSVSSVEQSGGENPTTCSSNISKDALTVVYATEGIGLVEGFTTTISRIYSFNISNGNVELLTPQVTGSGAYFPSVSGDGSKVVFTSDDGGLPAANGESQIYLIDRANSTISLVSQSQDGQAGNATSSRAEISHDGLWVAYTSRATDLKGAELSAGMDDFQIFLLNLNTGEHTLVSRTATGEPGNGFSLGVDISGDGRYTVFNTEAPNLTTSGTRQDAEVLLFDRDAGTLEVIGLSTEGKRIKGSHEILRNAISSDGNLVVFRALIGSFSKFRKEVYVRDRLNSRTYLSSFSGSCAFGEAGGESHSGSIAPDVPSLSFAVGKDTKRSALQLTLVGLDVLKNIATAPQNLDEIDADICGDTATLAMTPFAINSAALSSPRALSRGITYETLVKSSDRSSGARQLQSKKNLIALSNLQPGNYNASYRVKVSTPEGVTKSRFSKPTKFRIK